MKYETQQVKCYQLAVYDNEVINKRTNPVIL